MLKKLQLITFGLALIFAGSASAVYAGCGSCGPEADDHVHAKGEAHDHSAHAKSAGDCCGTCGGKKAAGECGGCESKKDCEGKEGDCCGKCDGAKAKSVVNVSAKSDCGGCTGAKTESTSIVSASTAGEGACSASAKSCGDGMKTAYSIGSKVNCFKADHAQSGEAKSLTGLAGSKATVLIFWNQNCPYVKEADSRIAGFAKEYKAKGVNVIAIDSGVTNSKSDIASYAEDRPFPVLVNNDSSVAAQFGAVRTPEVFVLDGDKTIVYHGAFDSGRERQPNTRKHYVKDAVDAVLAGNAPSVNKTPAFGCGIKYQKGVKALPTSNVVADASIK